MGSPPSHARTQVVWVRWSQAKKGLDLGVVLGLGMVERREKGCGGHQGQAASPNGVILGWFGGGLARGRI